MNERQSFSPDITAGGETYNLSELHQRYMYNETQGVLDDDLEHELGKILALGREARAAVRDGETLSAEAIISYKAAVREGRKAFEIFFYANQGLVVSRANRFYHGDFRLSPKISWEDLIIAGQEELAACIETFDPMRGTKFSTHAQERIERAMLRYIYENERTIRIGRSARDRLTKFRKHVREGMSEEAAAKATGSELETIRAIEAALERADVLHYDAPVNGSDGDHTILETLQLLDDGLSLDDDVSHRITIRAVVQGLRRALLQRPQSQTVNIRAFACLMARRGLEVSIGVLTDTHGVSQRMVTGDIKDAIEWLSRRENLPDDLVATLEELGYRPK